MVGLIPELERDYRRRRAKQDSRRILDNLGSESLSDIHLLFTQTVETMDDFYNPIDFTAIAGYPHPIPDKVVETLTMFQGNNAITAESHVKKISQMINRWCRAATSKFEDVYMRLFALSVDEDAYD